MECKNLKCLINSLGRGCSDDESCENYKPPTNADRIRAMSEKELAEFMRDMMDCVSCRTVMSRHDITCTGNYNECLGKCKQWLRQPAERNDTNEKR